MAINVSTRRELMTFSRHACELSGEIVRKGGTELGLVENEDGASGPLPENGDVADEATEVVRRRFVALIVGADETGKGNPAELLLELVAKLAVPDTLTLDAALLLPLDSPEA
jgi:hypothetical protein